MILSASSRWLAWATLAVVTLGCQGLTACATSRHGLMVVLPSDAAAIDAHFLADTTPSVEATAGLLQRGSSGRIVAGLNRTDAATE